MEQKNWDLVKVEKEFNLIKNNKEFVVLDLETTGFSPKKGAKIIQVAAIRVKNGKITKKRFASFVNPEVNIPKEITELTGITNHDVEQAPKICTILWALKAFIGDAVVVAHNAAFDWETFLYPSFEQQGIPMKNDYFCTYKLFHEAVPGLGKGAYTNEALAKAFGIKLTNAHSADSDVEATARSLVEIIKWFKKVDFEALKKAAEEKAKAEAETPVEVTSVNYWEKAINPLTTYQRQYIRLQNKEGKGTVFYDNVNQSWKNKDFPGKLNFKSVESAVLNFLGLSEVSELVAYRN